MAKIVMARSVKNTKLAGSGKKTAVKQVKKVVAKKITAAPKKLVVKEVQAQPKNIKKNTDKIAAKAAELLAKKAENPVADGAKAKPKNTMFGKSAGRPPGRRGRRPKNMDYQPSNNEEETSYVLESDYESLEYDTGIRLKDGKEDLMSLDRVEDFDEELNFDW